MTAADSNGEKNRLRTLVYTLLGILMAVNAWAIKDYIAFKFDQATFRIEQKAKDRQQDTVDAAFQKAFQRHDKILCAMAQKMKVVVSECDSQFEDMLGDR